MTTPKPSAKRLTKPRRKAMTWERWAALDRGSLLCTRDTEWACRDACIGYPRAKFIPVTITERTRKRRKK